MVMFQYNTRKKDLGLSSYFLRMVTFEVLKSEVDEVRSHLIALTGRLHLVSHALDMFMNLNGNQSLTDSGNPSLNENINPPISLEPLESVIQDLDAAPLPIQNRRRTREDWTLEATSRFVELYTAGHKIVDIARSVGKTPEQCRAKVKTERKKGRL